MHKGMVAQKNKSHPWLNRSSSHGFLFCSFSFGVFGGETTPDRLVSFISYRNLLVGAVRLPVREDRLLVGLGDAGVSGPDDIPDGDISNNPGGGVDGGVTSR